MKRKTNNKKVIAIGMILLLVISIGYAALSTNLTINGTANISATSWNIYFDNVQVTTGSVTGDKVTTAPTVEANSTSTVALTYTVTLDEPGDFYEFTVDVVNGGTIDAKIAEGGITKTTLSASEDILANYTVTYSNGDAISEGDTLAKSGATGDTKTIKVRVEYDSNVTAEQLGAMANDMTLTLTFALDYVQA